MRERQVGSQDYEWESVLLTCLSERDVKSTRAYTVNRRSERVERIDFTRLSSLGQVAFVGGERVEVVFERRSDDTYQLNFQLPQYVKGNGIGARLRLRGWAKFRYVAIGYSVGPKSRLAFRHVKVSNPCQGRWMNVVFGHGDLAYGMQNDWKHVPDAQIGDIRIYIRGEPECDTAFLDVEEFLCWREPQPKVRQLRADTIDPRTEGGLIDLCAVSNDIYGYLRKKFSEPDILVRDFLERRRFPIPSGPSPIQLEWPQGQAQPIGLETNTSYRYSWHALHIVSLLMLYERDTGGGRAVDAAVDFVKAWLARSYLQVDSDQKYTWYNHGVAERTIAFVLLWEYCVRHGVDSLFIKYLESTMLSHGQLLESEVFYVSHQRVRWHNHAWFQDIALLLLSVAFKQWPCAQRWRDVALLRLKEQHLHLIEQEGEFAVSIENSADYHHATHYLVILLGTLVSHTQDAAFFERFASQMGRFSEVLRYPDGRSPAQGDTFRLQNPGTTQTDRCRDQPHAEPVCVFLPVSGYGIIKGNHDGLPYMLAVFATTLSSTHKHEDNLSFTLYFDGIEWLLDPSFYSHEYTDVIPAYLRSAIAHNALVIPSLSYRIEPGLASLSGRRSGDCFELSGTHKAYQDAQVSRNISGRVDHLCFEVLDHAEAVDGFERPLLLMFHCGDGVDARCEGRSLFLSHPKSAYELHISLPVWQPKLYKGCVEEEKVRGVTGMGFEQLVSINTIECSVPANRPLKWDLRAIRRDRYS